MVAGQLAAGIHPVFRATYGERRSPGGTPESDESWAARLLVRQLATGLRSFSQIKKPVPGAGVLFRDPDGRPIHVGVYMPDGRMAHVNTTTATTLASIGAGSDYHGALSGFYLPG